MSTYFESAQGVTITRARAAQEVRNHGVDWREFLAEVGDHATYNAQDVLEWLGY